jgi:hypothetical protein
MSEQSATGATKEYANRSVNMAEQEMNIYDFPGKRGRSQVWKYFGFLKVDTNKPPIKENLQLSKLMWRANYARKRMHTSVKKAGRHYSDLISLEYWRSVSSWEKL